MWVWVVILGLAWGLVFAISPWQSSRYLMAKNEHVVMRSACAATCILALLWPVIYFSGAAIALSNAFIQPEERAMIWAAMNLMPPLVGATLLAEHGN